MSKRQNITIRVCDLEQYDGDWPTPSYPALLVDAIAWFNSKLAEIPEQYRANARCEIDSTSGYEGSTYGHIQIDYERPETDEEMAARIDREEATEREIKCREIATLRALQAKYRTST